MRYAACFVAGVVAGALGAVAVMAVEYVAAMDAVVDPADGEFVAGQAYWNDHMTPDQIAELRREMAVST